MFYFYDFVKTWYI